jgi:hypothetical protein
VNWCRFPVNYILSHAVGVVSGWVFTGLALAAIIKRPAAAAAWNNPAATRLECGIPFPHLWSGVCRWQG